MALFKNTVVLRGFLAKDAETPVDRIEASSYAVLLLGTASGTWDVATNAWTPCIQWHRIICPGPWFCGFTRGMRRGDYLEVEGELRDLEQQRDVIVAGERFPVKHATYAVHAIHIRRLERPLMVVDTGDDG